MASAHTLLSQVISNNYGGVSVLPNTKVSYVNLLQGRGDTRFNFIFVKKELGMSRPKQSNVPSRCDMKTGDPDLDLTGSPLKDDFQLEDIEDMSIEKEEHYKLWSETEESYSGVSVNLARDIVNDIGEMEESSRKCGPVWLLCNGSDLERTRLLVNEISADWWSRGVVVEQEPISIEIVKMENLMAQHLDRYPGLKTFDTEIESTYYLKHNIHVRVDMAFHRQIPSFTYFQGAQVTLKQVLATSENGGVQADVFWSNILTLSYIKKYILAHSSSNRNEPLYECGTGMRLRDIKEEIANLFTTVVFGTDLDDQNKIPVKEDLESVVASAKSRDYTDITDSLWNLLKCCASFQDLKAAFNFMFHFVQMNNICNIPANKNHVATLIKEISEGRLSNLCLSGTEPLELLLEIGLEKVEKDYEYIFVRSQTTTAQDLKNSSEFYKENVTVKTDGMIRKSVFHSMAKGKMSKAVATSRTTLLLKAKDVGEEDEGFHYSDFDENEVEMKLCRLAHFHGILAHLLQLRSVFDNVDVFASIMEHMLQQPMHYPFRVVKDRGFKDLEMEVVNNSLLKLVKDKFPHVRRVSFETKKPLIEARTTFVHSLDPIFPGAAHGDLVADDKDEKTMLSQQQYHQYYFKHTRTRLPRV